VFDLNSESISDLGLKQLELARKRKKLEASYKAGKISQSTYEYIVKELTKAVVDLEVQTKEVSYERGFHFYEDAGKPTGQIALSLEDFARKVRDVSLASLEFHQERGDYANWIRDVFGEYSLAETVRNLKEKGEDLRKKILETIEGPQQNVVFLCPSCGKEVSPKRIWKMKGRPNRAGKTLQITLAHYQCLDCRKSFRQVLSKEIM